MSDKDSSKPDYLRSKTTKETVPATYTVDQVIYSARAQYPVCFRGFGNDRLESLSIVSAKYIGYGVLDVNISCPRLYRLEVGRSEITRYFYERDGSLRTSRIIILQFSRRRIAMTPKLALYLRDYKAEQMELVEKLGGNLNLDNLVFTTIEGKPIDPSVLSHAFHKIILSIGLDGVRFHDLRYTFASLMLMRGAKPKVISEALGHSSVAFTMDGYSHIIERTQSDATELLNEVLPTGYKKLCRENVATF